MRRYLAFILILFSVPLYSQLIYDKWGDIVPFSQSAKYGETISASTIHSLVLPSFNNDSIFYVKNMGKTRDEVGNTFAAGFDIDTSINIRECGKRFDIEEGTLWIYTIESPTAKSISLEIEDFDIPEGAYLCFITTDFAEHDPVTFTKATVQASPYQSENYYWAKMEGKRAIVEYFEPKNVVSDFDIKLSKISYFFAGVFGEKSKLKSGVHGQTIFDCQHDVMCQSVAGWEEEANSVGCIVVAYPYLGDTWYTYGTAFFINKVGNYSLEDKPYFITCGHLFYPEPVSDVHVDISTSYYDRQVEVWVDYLNPDCESTKMISGTKIGNVNRLLLGSNYMGTNDYKSEDYSFWETNRDVESLLKKTIKYAAWNYYLDVYEEGWASLGHPSADVMKVLIEDDAISYNDLYKTIALIFDKGYNAPQN